MNLTELVVNGSTFFFNSTVAVPLNGSSCDSLYRKMGIVKILAIHRPMVATVDKFVTPVWYAIGFPGNLLAFIVWIQNTWYVNTLYLPVWCELFPILYLSSQHLSPLLVLGFTVERYISICHPFQRERFCSTRRAMRVIAALACFVLLLNAVQGYFWKYTDPECSVREEAVRNDTRSLWSVWSWVTELLIFGVVPIVILVLNILVIKEAKRMSDREKAMMTTTATTTKAMTTTTGGGGGGQSSATTLTLLVVSFYLIFSTLPVTVCYALYYRFPEGDECTTAEEFYTDDKWQRHFSYWNARMFVQEIGMSHYSGNFFIYLVTGLAFRRELKALAMRLFCHRSVKLWLTRNATEMTELTTFHRHHHHHRHKSTAASSVSASSNGRLNGSDNSGGGETKVML